MNSEEIKRREALVEFLMRPEEGVASPYTRDQLRLVVDVATEASLAVIPAITAKVELLREPELRILALGVAFKSASVALEDALATTKAFIEDKAKKPCDCLACQLEREFGAMGMEPIDLGEGITAFEFKMDGER